jgi:hypothetical protein
VHNGSLVYRGTWTLKVKGSAITGLSHWTCCPGPRADPVDGSVAGSKVTIHRDCSAQGQTACVRQTFVVNIVANPKNPAIGTLSGTWSGDGAAPSNDTFTSQVKLRLRRFKLSGTVLAQKCSTSGCSRRPRADVTVVAKNPGTAATGSARTGKDGRYVMRLGEGAYDVSLSGVKGIPARRTVTLTEDVSGADFHVCGARSAADAGPLAHNATVLHCDFKVKVTVVDVHDKPLRRVRVQAATSGPWTDFLGPDVVLGETGSDGRATLDLWTGDPWVVRVINELPDINPPNSFDTSHGEPLYSTHTSCVEGTGFLGGCKFTSRDARSGSVAIEVKALVVPLNVTLNSPLGFGQIIVERNQTVDTTPPHAPGFDPSDPRYPFLDLHSGDNGPLPHQLRFELPIDSRAGAEEQYYVEFAPPPNGSRPTISACSPGGVVDLQDTYHTRACRIVLDSNITFAQAAFSAAP